MTTKAKPFDVNGTSFATFDEGVLELRRIRNEMRQATEKERRAAEAKEG